jgi:hypothetical protein
MTTSAAPLLSFLATYLVHSTLLPGAAGLLARYVARSEAGRGSVVRLRRFLIDMRQVLGFERHQLVL